MKNEQQWKKREQEQKIEFFCEQYETILHKTRN